MSDPTDDVIENALGPDATFGSTTLAIELNTARLNDMTRPHIPGTDYYDGRDGSIEADDDDEDRIAEQDRIMAGELEPYYGDPRGEDV